MNTSLRNVVKVGQLIDTSEVIQWLKNISNKQKHEFSSFDIKDFYSTVTKDLLTKYVTFAKEKVKFLMTYIYR